MQFSIIWTEMKNVISDICPCPPVPPVLLGLMLRGVLITDNSRGTDMQAVFDERIYLLAVSHFKYLIKGSSLT